ncbi:MAG: O-antigen ligase family protein [Pseudomonadota bacterium]
MVRGRDVTFPWLLAIVFLLPLPLGSNRDWLWMPLAAATFLLAAVVCNQLLREQATTSRALREAWPAHLALGTWLVFGAIQFLVPMPWLGRAGNTISVEPAISASVWFQSLFLVVLFSLTLQLARSRRRVRRLMGVMVLAGVVQATYGALMTLSDLEFGAFGPKEHGIGLATGTFINRNHFAGFLELCLAVGLGALVAELGESQTASSTRAQIRNLAATLLGPKMRLRLSLAVMVVALVLSRSRMGNTAFFASLLITGALALLLMRRPPRSLVILLVSLLAIDILIVGTWFGVEQVVDRIQETGQYNETTGRYQDEDRLDVDAETLIAFAGYRWLGSGGGTFYTVFPSHRPADVAAYFDHAHNDYFEFLLEYGLLGVVPLVAFLLMSAATALHALRRRRDPLMKGVGFAVLMAVAAMGIHATVDFNLHIPANAAYFMMILALAWIAQRHRSRNGSGSRGRDGSVDRSEPELLKNEE